MIAGIMLLPADSSTYSPAPDFCPYIDKRFPEMLLAEHETVGYSHYLIVVLHVHAISTFQIAHLSMHSLDNLLPVIIHDDAIITESSVELWLEDAVNLIVHLREREHGKEL